MHLQAFRSSQSCQIHSQLLVVALGQPNAFFPSPEQFDRITGHPLDLLQPDTTGMQNLFTFVGIQATHSTHLHC